MRAHALGKLDLHRDVGRGAGANGRRESVVDRLARLPRGRRRRRCALREMRRRLGERFGLQARMTASYVVVTAAAVILVEGIAIGVLIPSLLSNQDLRSRVAETAANVAQQVALVSTSPDRVIPPPNYSL